MDALCAPGSVTSKSWGWLQVMGLLLDLMRFTPSVTLNVEPSISRSLNPEPSTRQESGVGMSKEKADSLMLEFLAERKKERTEESADLGKP